MRSKTNILNPDLHQYLLTILPQESPICQKIRAVTQQHPYKDMQITPEQGTLLKWLVQVLNPSIIIEVGVFTGYSTISMAEALNDTGILYACDKNKAWTDIGQAIWKDSPHQHKIQLTILDGVTYLKQCITQNIQADLIFIDADKANYPLYYELGLSLLKPGGTLIIDNIFLMGRVITDPDHKQTAKMIRKLNQTIKTDPRITPAIIPIGDGMTLIHKKVI